MEVKVSDDILNSKMLMPADWISYAGVLSNLRPERVHAHTHARVQLTEEI